MPIPKRKPEQKNNICDEIAEAIKRIEHLLAELAKTHTKNDEEIARLEVELELAQQELERIQLREIIKNVPTWLDNVTKEPGEEQLFADVLITGMAMNEDLDLKAAKQRVSALQQAISALQTEQRALENKIQGLENELLTLELQRTENCG